MLAGIIIGSLFALLLAVLLIRTLMFVPPKVTRGQAIEENIDEDWVCENLAAMVRCKTVSSFDKSEEDEGEFLKFENVLKERFPKIFEVCSFERVSNRAMLIRCRGESIEGPTVLMAHYDVVNVVEEDWEKPPFDGIIEDGVLWGRGTIDTKGTLNGAMSALELLLRDGFVPKSDIYLAFAGDEEVNGEGAKSIVALFKERNITPALVLDEGGAVVSGLFPGVKRECAVIGIAEKGLVNIEYSISGGGGHASAPKPHTPVGRLSAACVRVENNPFKFRLTTPTKKMFDTVCRYSTFVYRLIFSNLWFFAPVLNLIGKKSGGQINAVARTTVAFTMMQGSSGINVIPPRASIGSNSRILPGETAEGTVARIRKIVKDKDIVIRDIGSHNPSRISRTDCEAYERIKDSALDVWQDIIVSPYLMTACSDARHWSEISDRVYRFSPMRLSPEENAMVHGNNERLPKGSIAETVKFYLRLIKKS